MTYLSFGKGELQNAIPIFNSIKNTLLLLRKQEFDNLHERKIGGL